MEIGIPKEIKVHEYRVGQSPAGVAALWAQVCASGSRVAQAWAPALKTAPTSGGAQIVATADEAWNAEMVIKVKADRRRMASYAGGSALFTYSTSQRMRREHG